MKKSTSRDSQTDLEKISKMEDKAIDFSDIPEITEEQFARVQ